MTPWPVSGACPLAREKSAKPKPGAGADRSEPCGGDLSFMPAGMWCRQLDITSPNTRVCTPCPRR